MATRNITPCTCFLLTLFGIIAAHIIFYDMRFRWASGLLLAASSSMAATGQDGPLVDLSWYAPKKTSVNDLSQVINGTGIYEFIFNNSNTPSDLPYNTYNWCNMPHVRAQEYVKAPAEYELRYVELIHRHHKRTPYAANTFPQETTSWYCNDEALFYYGSPQPEGNAAAIAWQVTTSLFNPLAPTGFNGTCQFPQITAGGLEDSRQHGKDLYGVYHDLLHFLPDQLDREKVSFRVTNNVITSQVAGQVVYGMYPVSNHVSTPVLIQPSSVDSLEPGYTCTAASLLYSIYGVGSGSKNWSAHLDQSVDLFARLDSVSGVNASSAAWHTWFDHYFDNLSARLCHNRPLPCSSYNSSLCIIQPDADAVFRRGEYEYSFIYRDSPQSLQASVASYGIWTAELAGNLRNAMAGQDQMLYRHNFAHDGSLARLLSILQVDVMVWPGMGSEMVFELYTKSESWFVRVLWGGQVLKSSNPSLGSMDMLPVEVFLAYIDGLVGVGASKISSLCRVP